MTTTIASDVPVTTRTATRTGGLAVVAAEHVEPSRYRDEAAAGCVGTVDRFVIRLHSRLQGRVTSFAAFYRPAGIGTRHVQDGPVDQTDCAFLVPLSTCLVSADYGDAFRPHTVLEASAGDLLVFAGHVWEISDDAPWQDPKLTLVR